MVFQFELMDLDAPSGADHSPLVHTDWKLSDFKEIIRRWQKFEREKGFWNTCVRRSPIFKFNAPHSLFYSVFIENHDQSRSVSRWGNGSQEWRALSAKMFAILQVTQSGTQYVFQGQELGLKNFPRSWGIEEYKDVASQNYWNG